VTPTDGPVVDPRDDPALPSVAQALDQARRLGLDRLDAQLLLGHLLQHPRAWLIAHDETLLARAEAAAFADGCGRRAAGEPLAYLLGEREFHGLLLQVSPDVLIPRPDTETLVDWALDLLPASGADRPKVLDLGTGSGAIALAVAHRRPNAEVTATDLSPAALAIAQANAHRLGLSLAWAAGPWWQAVTPQARFDLVLCNPPYIAGDDPHLPALRHEPLLALTPGGDGLDALREVIRGAPAHLAAGGWLLLEHGWDQQHAVTAELQRAGFCQLATRRDIEGRPRCTGGQMPGRQRPTLPGSQTSF
jgi:release factor glutamine methyltransferase